MQIVKGMGWCGDAEDVCVLVWEGVIKLLAELHSSKSTVDRSCSRTWALHKSRCTSGLQDEHNPRSGVNALCRSQLSVSSE